ncbi:MAG: HAMP domain-containing protein [Anaerolineae bacterium]
MKRWTLRRKIVSFVIVIMAVFLVTRAIGDARQSYNVYLHFVTEEARGTAETLASVISHGDYWGDPDRMQDLLSTLRDRAGQSARDMLVVDMTGQVLAASDTAMLGSVVSEDVQRKLHAALDGNGTAAFGVPDTSSTINELATPIEVGGQTKGALLVQYSLDPAKLLASTNAKSEVFVFTVMTMGLVLILLVGLRKMVLQPLAILEQGAARFGKGNLDARIELKTGDELEVVSNAFNRMAKALKAYHEERIAQEKQATLVEVACVTASELSQPLTVVLGYAELLHEQEIPSPELLDEAARSIHRGSQKMTGIVRQLSSMGGNSRASGPPRQGKPAIDGIIVTTAEPKSDERSMTIGMLEGV